MELRQLAHFVAVAEDQHFTRAAARLHVAQSTLSVSVRGLERELGVRLFDRTTQRVTLTDAGEALLPEARRTLGAAVAARDAVLAVHGGIRGSVRLGLLQSLSLIDIGARLTRFAHARPGVQLLPETRHGGSAQLVRDVLQGSLDVSLAALPGGYPPEVVAIPLASEPMHLICAADSPVAFRTSISLDDLADLPFVDHPPGWGTRMAVDRHFAARGLVRRIAVEVADTPTLADLVRAGLGIAFAPASMLVGRQGLVVRELDPPPVFTVSVVLPAGRPPSAATQALVDVLTDAGEG